MHTVLILAAGKGKRMKSELTKVLHKALGNTLLDHVLSAASFGKSDTCLVVSPHNKEQISKQVSKNIKICVQKTQKGTADAVKAAMPLLKKNKIKSVLVIPGDMPLIRKETIKQLFKIHNKKKNKVTVLTGELENPKGYGRIIRSISGKVISITEEKDLDKSQKNIKEINTGVYFFEVDFLEKILGKINSKNAQKEFYLTDSIEIAAKIGESQGKRLVEALNLGETNECMGVNSRVDLAEANKVLRNRKIKSLMDSGVTIEDPDSTFIDMNVKIGKDTVIKPFCVITGDVTIGKFCEIGPFAHIREGVKLLERACVGNFVEVKKTVIGKGSKAKHLTYLGNAVIGSKVNIGAGTITANYDGVNKHVTTIKDGCKIGSNTVIVAPNVLPKNVMTGAGTVVTANKKICANALLCGVPARIAKRNLTVNKK